MSDEAKVPMVIEDNGPLAQFLDSRKFQQLYRVANMFSDSDMVPQHYHGKPSNCMIAIEMAARMQLAPMMFMQNTYIVHGKPGIESKLAIALINSSGLFEGNLDYEREGTDPKSKDYRVRAFAMRKDTGKPAYGPWVDWQMVEAEGWDQDKKGQKSKWKTMPGLMFDYRAAMFFARTICPERLMGMQTIEELQDVGGVQVPVSEIPREERIVDQIHLRDNQPKEKPADAEPPQEEPTKSGETNDTPTGLSVNEMRDRINELLAQHFDGDVEKMDAALSEIVGEQVTVDQIPMFDQNALPMVLDEVEKFVGETA